MCYSYRTECNFSFNNKWHIHTHSFTHFTNPGERKLNKFLYFSTYFFSRNARERKIPFSWLNFVYDFFKLLGGNKKKKSFGIPGMWLHLLSFFIPLLSILFSLSIYFWIWWLNPTLLLPNCHYYSPENWIEKFFE